MIKFEIEPEVSGYQNFTKMEIDILQKLKYKAGDKAVIIDRPDDVKIAGIPYDDKVLSAEYKFVLLFAKNTDDITFGIPPLIKACTHDALVWIAYPKKSSAIKTDISRDHGWSALEAVGFRAVSQVSLGDTWSALRFRPLEQVKSSPQAKTQTFEAVIEGATDGSGGAWVNIPFDVKEVYGTTGQVKVKATFDGHPYQGSIANMGSGHMLLVRKDVRETIGKAPGDKVKVTLERDASQREVPIPEELDLLLRQHPKAEEFYNSLSYTNRKEYAQWISSAKRAETKAKRLNETLEKLNRGMKNPFAK